MTTPILRAEEIAERFRLVNYARAEKAKTALFAKANDEKGELYIYDAISTWGGVTADAVASALKAMGDVKSLDIFINSPGGDVWQAKAIYASLLRFKATKNVFVDGIAASAASFIAMAGDTITTAKAATWMVHEAECLAYGRADELETMAGMVRKENAAIAGIYASQTGGTVDEMLQLMSDTTWMSAAEALEAGFTDQVKDPDDDDDDDEPDETTAKAMKSRLVAAAVSTEQLVRHARQERRLSQLSTRASPASRDGKPSRITPQPHQKDTPR